MFGFRIIKEWDYKRFLKLEKERDEMENELREEIYQLSKDNGSLREQLNEMIKAVHKANIKHEDHSLSYLNNLCIIKSVKYKCDKCKFVNTDCKKLEFANQTICVCGKSDIELYK
jgi:hypothetical protein